MIGAFVLIVGPRWPSGSLGRLHRYMMIPLGVVLGALVAFIIFGRRAQKSVYRKAEGRPGPRRGRWTTCAASGGSRPASPPPATSTRCTG
jgi:hypothetical protein